MIRLPLGLRIASGPGSHLRDSIQRAAQLGARGIILDAAGEMAPERLGETGRRALRHLLRSLEVGLIALSLPTRRPFDTLEQLDDRLARADRAFAMAYELGTRHVLARVGGVPEESDPSRRHVFTAALQELGGRADRRGARLAIEAGAEPGATLRAFLEALNVPTLAASIDPSAFLQMGFDPVAAVRDLGPWVVHAYATDAANRARGTPPRGLGFPPGALDWEEYLGAFEQIDYSGFLTIWPDPARDIAAQFAAIKARLDRIV